MTTPEPVTALAGLEPAGADTALIAQLLRELSTEFRGGAPAAAGPSSTAPVRADLGGVYPSAAASHTPAVHPGVALPAAPQERDRTVEPPPGTASGAHSPGSTNTHAFGEPRCYRNQPSTETPHRPYEEATRNDATRFAPATPFSSLPAASPFYFLPDVAALTGPAGLEAVGGIPTVAAPFLNVDAIRADFPALHQTVHGGPLIWLDNAATTHKPQSVIDATAAFYARDNSNIHRAAHALAARATELYEGGREKVRRFLGAADAREIVFVRGTTEAINLVAQTYGRKFIGSGDEILLTTMEHHANIVPWQLLAEQTGAVIRVAPINDAGELILDQFATLLGPRTKLVAVTHVANALGTINPVEHIIALAHAYGVPVLVDAAQSTPHLPVNVQALDVDFLTFSGHKVFGPTGIGALYAKAHWLEQLPPWQGGGNMIRDVTFAKTTYQDFPQKFEAGTQDIAGVVGLGAAIDYLLALGLPAIAAYEHSLLEYATAALAEVPGLRPIGTASAKASVLSFVLRGHTSEQVGQHLDRHGIAVRSGHHCAQPALRRFGLESTVRPSLAFYNTREEIDALVRALRQLRH